MQNNHIGNEGARHIAVVLAEATMIETLDLTENGIGDEALSLLVEAAVRYVACPKLHGSAFSKTLLFISYVRMFVCMQ